MYRILLYYKYTKIADPAGLVAAQKALCEKLGLKGRILIAHEGINGTVEGTIAATDTYIKEMSADTTYADFSDIHWKKSEGTADGTAFPKLSIKLRKEIVSAHLDEKDPAAGDIDPTTLTGIHLAPEELRAWYEKGERFTIVDMRNDYEHQVGHFEGSILPPLENFRDLPRSVEALVAAGVKPEDKVLSVCTGGVRCEKASGYLLKRGFKNVYQLDGGIVSYMEKYPGKDFRGALYVFDGRVTMHFEKPDEHVVIGRCAHCAAASERYLNCKNAECHHHFICCAACSDAAGEAFCKKCNAGTAAGPSLA